MFAEFAMRPLPLRLMIIGTLLGAVAVPGPADAQARSVDVAGAFGDIPLPADCTLPATAPAVFSRLPGTPPKVKASVRCAADAPAQGPATPLGLACVPSVQPNTNGVLSSLRVAPGGSQTTSLLLVDCPPIDETAAPLERTSVTNLDVVVEDVFDNRAQYEAAPGSNRPMWACDADATPPGSLVSVSYRKDTRQLTVDCSVNGQVQRLECFTFDGRPVSASNSTSGLVYQRASRYTLAVDDCIRYGDPANFAENSPGLIQVVAPVDPDILLRNGFEPALSTSIAIELVDPVQPVAGQPYALTVRVTSGTNAPTGAVLVSDGFGNAGGNCTASLAADAVTPAPNDSTATCPLTWPSDNIRTRTVRATYAGTVGFDGSTTTRTVSAGLTAQTITFPSTTVQYNSQGQQLQAASTNPGNPITFTTNTAGCAILANPPRVQVVTSGPDAVASLPKTCTVVANQAAIPEEYTAAEPVSANIQVERANQALSITDPGPQTYPPATPFTVTAQGGASGRPIVFSAISTKVCSSGPSPGNVITPIATGECEVTANQGGNGFYNPAPQATITIPIRTGQTLTWVTPAENPSARTYAPAPGNTFAVTATASSGLPVQYSSGTQLVCSVSAGTVSILTAGTCTIHADQPGDTTYGPAARASRTINIARASQVIDLKSLPASRTYQSGGSFPVIVGVIGNGTAPLQMASLNESVCTVSTPVAAGGGNWTATVTMGTNLQGLPADCTLRATKAGDTNYEAAAAAQRTIQLVAPPP